jgi:ABC-type glutathione transport system ATPase component
MDARPTPPVLSVENLAVAFSSFGGDRAALDGISLAVRAGHVTSLVGETGSGKSVLVKAILRMLPQNARLLAGRVEIDGRTLHTPARMRCAGCAAVRSA